MTAVWPPGPPASDNLPEYGPESLDGLRRYAQEYGDFVPLRLGGRQAVLLCHPAYVEQVLVTKHRDLIRREAIDTGHYLLGDGLATSDGDMWRRQRRLAQPAFRRERLVPYADGMVACTERMLRSWREGEVRDVYDEMLRLAQEIMGIILFGVDSGDEAAEFTAALAEATVRHPNPPINRLLLAVADVLPRTNRFEYLRGARRLDHVTYASIRRRRVSGEQRNDLLSALLGAWDRDGSVMTDRQLRDEVVTLFLAGNETTANGLSWTLYLLERHPEVEGRLLAELEAVLGGRAPTVADLPDLRYLEWIVTEILRLYPPLPTIKREAPRACDVGGYAIPRRTILMMSPWVLHRDPRYFEQPERFHPERWADGLAARLPKFAYFPFGGGPHVCIGRELAMIELMLVLAMAAQRFRMEIAPNQDIRPAVFATLRPEGGMRAVVHRRSPEVGSPTGGG